jgi:hypothetical protein
MYFLFCFAGMWTGLPQARCGTCASLIEMWHKPPSQRSICTLLDRAALHPTSKTLPSFGHAGLWLLEGGVVEMVL